MRGVGLTPSGLAAITTTLPSVLSAGDHVLVTDNVYRPSRNFCNGMLARYGVETTYFDPLIGRLRKPRHPVRLRSISHRDQMVPGGPPLRLHIGLENVDDLKADLGRGFAALKAAAQGFSRPPIRTARGRRGSGRAACLIGPCGRSPSPAAATGLLRTRC
jgi:cystathionine beta-lyase/cystathionine gamma-synthase